MSPALPDGFEVVVLSDFARANGGAPAVALQTARGVADAGIPVTVFSAVGPVDPALTATPNLAVICLGQEEIVRDPRLLRAFARGVKNGPAQRALRTLLAGKDPARTVVHAHQWTKALSPAVLAEALDRGFPLAVTLHDFFVTCPNGGFFVYPRLERCERTPLSPSCLGCRCDRRSELHKIWRTARTWAQNVWWHVPARTHQFIGVSDFSAEIIRRHLPAGAALEVLHPPCERNDGGPADVRAHDAFLFVGRLVPEKGPDLFAAAAQRLGIKAVFVGDGEMRGPLQAEYPQHEYVGWLDERGVEDRMRRARALVFPSRWYETLGLVAVEAAACGLPVAVADSCAASRFLAHGRTALHFRSGSVDSLAEALARLRDDDLAARLGRGAYDWYWENPWTVSAHTDALLRLYARTLARVTPAEAAR